MASIQILAAHPQLQHSRVTRALMNSAHALPPGLVEVRDLYALYPDYLIDIAAEQAALEEARLVVWLHPVQWYGMPALMKLWVDEVLTYDWAYGGSATRLRGKDLWLVASTGGPQESYHPGGYNRYFFDAFLPPYEQTAALCGMRFLPPLLLHGAHRVTPEQLQAHVTVFTDRLRSHPDWPELDELEQCPQCLVPASARPAA
ncbi:NAD(P)H-dependent oxidoreductase [Eleftheria terrae]|uniref:glutathione-regulated potassium-efflux system oxidoreductase KefF n=1 Tax=Eleftheria terrae TaxID=1597781 RepID=UPI00263BC8B6|nr:NAD(P)H-dependent oxidoreductase [Eleftheria terrae]WKB52216.1 NAD(P)H-dependent oxidoreductase [Eleftheria terrae]